MKQLLFFTFAVLLTVTGCESSSDSSGSSAPSHEPIWSYQTGLPVRSSMVIKDSSLVFGDTSGTVHCINAGTGERIWRYTAGSAVNGKVTSNGSNVWFCTQAGELISLSVTDGAFQWKNSAEPSPAENSWDLFTASPSLADGILYYGSGKVFRAVNAETGETIWSAPIKAHSHMIPDVDDARVYFGDTSGYCYALSRADGMVIWSKQFSGMYGDNIQGQATYHDGRVYFSGRDARIHCINTSTWQEEWQYYAVSGSWIPSLSAASDGFLYAGTSDDNSLHAFDPVTGSEIWKYAAAGRIFTIPFIHDDMIIFGTETGGMMEYASGRGSLSAVSLSDGTEQWSINLPQNVVSSPAVYGSLVIVGCDDGNVYAFNLNEL